MASIINVQLLSQTMKGKLILVEVLESAVSYTLCV